MTNNHIKVAACQLLTSEDVSANTAKVLQQIEACAELEIQIAAFPEGCLFGYCCRTDYWEHISPQVFSAGLTSSFGSSGMGLEPAIGRRAKKSLKLAKSAAESPSYSAMSIR